MFNFLLVGSTPEEDIFIYQINTGDFCTLFFIFGIDTSSHCGPRSNVDLLIFYGKIKVLSKNMCHNPTSF